MFTKRWSLFAGGREVESVVVSLMIHRRFCMRFVE